MNLITQRAIGLLGAVAIGLTLSATPAMSYAALFSSDMSTSTGWTVGTLFSDDIATFGYDYSADGVPAPPGGSDTIGLRLESNTTADSDGFGSVQVWTDQTFAGTYVVEFDVWANLSFAGGTTEYYGGGIGHDQASIMQGVGSSTSDGSGGLMVLVTDGSSSRDYRLYKDSGEQFIESGQYAVDSNNGSDPAFAGISPSVDVSLSPLDVQGQTGVSDVGDPVFNWYHVKISVNESLGMAKYELGTLELGTLNANIGNSFPMDGAVSLVHMDTFSSVATNLAFSIYDNVVVTIPEPSTTALLGFGTIGLLGMMRRRR